MTSRTDFASRIAAAIAAGEAGGDAILLSGGPGWGKTTLLRGIERELSENSALLPIVLNLDEICFSPEFLLEKVTEKFARILKGVRDKRPARPLGKPAVSRVFEMVDEAGKTAGREPILLVDETAELAVLKSFPGQGDPLADFLSGCRGRSVALTTAFPARLLKAASKAGTAVREMEIPAISSSDIQRLAGDFKLRLKESEAAAIGRAAGGSPAYAHALLQKYKGGKSPSVQESIEAGLRKGNALELLCRFNYEYLVQKSRGQGIVRRLLAVLAGFEAEQGRANLTMLAEALDRSLGVTKDYLKWLLDVDLIESADKRYWIKDRLLASWIRLYRSGESCDDEGLARESRILAGEADASDGAASVTGVGRRESTRPRKAGKPPVSRPKPKESTVSAESPGQDGVQYIVHRPKPGGGLVELD